MSWIKGHQKNRVNFLHAKYMWRWPDTLHVRFTLRLELKWLSVDWQQHETDAVHQHSLQISCSTTLKTDKERQESLSGFWEEIRCSKRDGHTQAQARVRGRLHRGHRETDASLRERERETGGKPSHVQTNCLLMIRFVGRWDIIYWMDGATLKYLYITNIIDLFTWLWCNDKLTLSDLLE